MCADVRIVMVTNCDREALVKEGAFRVDLYHRLKRHPLRLPPLRERAGGIPTRNASCARSGTGRGRPTRRPSCSLTVPRPDNIREVRNLCDADGVAAAALDPPTGGRGRSLT